MPFCGDYVIMEQAGSPAITGNVETGFSAVRRFCVNPENVEHFILNMMATDPDNGFCEPPRFPGPLFQHMEVKTVRVVPPSDVEPFAGDPIGNFTPGYTFVNPCFDTPCVDAPNTMCESCEDNAFIDPHTQLADYSDPDRPECTLCCTPVEVTYGPVDDCKRGNCQADINLSLEQFAPNICVSGTWNAAGNYEFIPSMRMYWECGPTCNASTNPNVSDPRRLGKGLVNRDTPVGKIIPRSDYTIKLGNLTQAQFDFLENSVDAFIGKVNECPWTLPCYGNGLESETVLFMGLEQSEDVSYDICNNARYDVSLNYAVVRKTGFASRLSECLPVSEVCNGPAVVPGWNHILRDTPDEDLITQIGCPCEATSEYTTSIFLNPTVSASTGGVQVGCLTVSLEPAVSTPVASECCVNSMNNRAVELGVESPINFSVCWETTDAEGEPLSINQLEVNISEAFKDAWSENVCDSDFNFVSATITETGIDPGATFRFNSCCGFPGNLTITGAPDRDGMGGSEVLTPTTSVVENFPACDGAIWERTVDCEGNTIYDRADLGGLFAGLVQ